MTQSDEMPVKDYIEVLKKRISDLEEINRKLRNENEALILDIAFYERNKSNGQQ